MRSEDNTEKAGRPDLLLYLEQAILQGKDISNHMAREMLVEFDRFRRQADPRHFTIIKSCENQLRDYLEKATTRADAAEKKLAAVMGLDWQNIIYALQIMVDSGADAEARDLYEVQIAVIRAILDGKEKAK